MRPQKGILLDTHVLLWSMKGASEISRRLTQLFSSQRPIYFSAVSFVEIAIKAQRTTLPELVPIARHLTALGLRELPLDAASASAVTRFPGLEGHDPFDRMLVAQAITHNLTLETADRKLLALGIPGITDATS